MPYVSENVGEIIYASMDDDAESYIRYSQNVGDFPCSIALKKTGFEYSYIYLHFISFFHNHKMQVFEILIGWMHCLPLNNCPKYGCCMHWSAKVNIWGISRRGIDPL